MTIFFCARSGSAGTTGQDGAPPVSECPLGTSAKDLGCVNCMLGVCKTQYAAMCKDGTKVMGQGYLESCANGPSVTQGQCEQVFIDASALSIDVREHSLETLAVQLRVIDYFLRQRIGFVAAIGGELSFDCQDGYGSFLELQMKRRSGGG